MVISSENTQVDGVNINIEYVQNVDANLKSNQKILNSAGIALNRVNGSADTNNHFSGSPQSQLQFPTPAPPSYAPINNSASVSANKIKIETLVHNKDTYFRPTIPYQDHSYGCTVYASTSPMLKKKVSINLKNSTNSHEKISPMSVQLHNSPRVLEKTASIFSKKRLDKPKIEADKKVFIEKDKAYITRCICGFEHDDGYMICCDECGVWQHVVCMGMDKSTIPDEYLCEICCPRVTDVKRAILLQKKNANKLTSNSSSDEISIGRNADNSSINDYFHNPTSKPSKSHVKQVNIERRKIISLYRKRRKRQSDTSHLSFPEKSFIINKLNVNYTFCQNNIVRSELKNIFNPAQCNFEISNKIENCYLNLVDADTLCLCASNNIPTDQPVIEYVGEVGLLDSYLLDNDIYVSACNYALFYKKFQEEILIDSNKFGNLSRFIRRSCTPNCMVQHILQNDSIHFIVYSTQNILKNVEITIPFDIDYEKCEYYVECACKRLRCPVDSRIKKPIKKSIVETPKIKKDIKVVNIEKIIEPVLLPVEKIYPKPIVKPEKIQPVKANPPIAIVSAFKLDSVEPVQTSTPKIKVKAHPKEKTLKKIRKKTYSKQTIENSSEESFDEFSDDDYVVKNSSKKEPVKAQLIPISKMTREERKIAQLMELFAKIEKRDARRKSVKPKKSKIKVKPKSKNPKSKPKSKNKIKKISKSFEKLSDREDDNFNKDVKCESVENISLNHKSEGDETVESLNSLKDDTVFDINVEQSSIHVSAKKRWLKQALSDSSTVTVGDSNSKKINYPIKKRWSSKDSNDFTNENSIKTVSNVGTSEIKNETSPANGKRKLSLSEYRNRDRPKEIATQEARKIRDIDMRQFNLVDIDMRKNYQKEDKNENFIDYLKKGLFH
ncbi:hypothetical protein A3Q56_01132 [Intoshia linei]|uniref:SET domain-containing protein n=1 Tax=Intoshia linei TaxID=1819745 RepID=A0A177B9W4_9BILA|nr:hypothetical protein A3Q56_01132 [Intoshia linei]